MSSTVTIYRKPLTVEEAADWLTMSERSVLKFARSGLLRATKVGGTWRFNLKDLAAFAGAESEQIEIEDVVRFANDLSAFEGTVAS